MVGLVPSEVSTCFVLWMCSAASKVACFVRVQRFFCEVESCCALVFF